MGSEKSVIITGAGHSGTNLVLEALRLSGTYKFYPDDGMHTEDRNINLKLITGLPEFYGTKLCTENECLTAGLIDNYLNKNPFGKFVFCIRSPIDTALSRAFAFKGKDGHDGKGTIIHLAKTANILDYLWTNYPDNLVIVYMNDLLKDFNYYTKELADNLNIRWIPEMEYAYKKIRISEYKTKYSGTLDIRRTNVLAHEKELFGNFFEGAEAKIWKENILEYFANGGEIWRHRPAYALWEVTMV